MEPPENQVQLLWAFTPPYLFSLKCSVHKPLTGKDLTGSSSLLPRPHSHLQLEGHTPQARRENTHKGQRPGEGTLHRGWRALLQSPGEASVSLTKVQAAQSTRASGGVATCPELWSVRRPVLSHTTCWGISHSHPALLGPGPAEAPSGRSSTRGFNGDTLPLLPQTGVQPGRTQAQALQTLSLGLRDQELIWGNQHWSVMGRPACNLRGP